MYIVTVVLALSNMVCGIIGNLLLVKEIPIMNVYSYNTD